MKCRFKRASKSYRILGVDLPIVEGRVLFEIVDQGITKNSGLSSKLGLDPAQVSRVLVNLQKRNYICKKPSKTDGRSHDFVPTSEGKKVTKVLIHNIEKKIRNIFKKLGPTHKIELLSAMEKLIDLLAKV